MPPKYSTAFRPILHLLTRLSLRFEFRVDDVSISGLESVTHLAREGHSVLVAPNHADHADPGLMVTAARRGGFAFHFMAAREGFERHRIHQWVLQKSGAFSINREGGDLASIKMAIKTLQEGRFPLVIFPEGEIYHHMESLDELNEGVASIALRASAKLPEGKRGYVVPASIVLKHDPGVEASFSERLSALEERITLKPRIDASPVDRILSLGSTLLAIKEEEFLGASRQGELVERIQYLRESIVSEVEGWHGLSKIEPTMPKRVKALRALIRKELTEGKQPPSEERTRELYDHLDRIFVAHQLYSYPGTYLKAQPTVDRIAETIFKLEEDVVGKARYLGKRHAAVTFGEPIEIGAFLKANELNGKTAVQPLTQHIRERIQNLLPGE